MGLQFFEFWKCFNLQKLKLRIFNQLYFYMFIQGTNILFIWGKEAETVSRYENAVLIL